MNGSDGRSGKQRFASEKIQKTTRLIDVRREKVCVLERETERERERER